MKWFLMVAAILLIPVSLQAQHSGAGAYVVIIGEKWNDTRPHEVKVFLAVDEDGNFIKATIHAYVQKNMRLIPFHKLSAACL